VAEVKKLDIEVRLEGVLVEFCKVSISTRVNQPSSAVIDLVPVSKTRHIRPRTGVQVFYFDDAVESTAPDDTKWKLLFDGEVTGRGFIKESGQRMFRLYCSDISNYFRSVMLAYYSGFDIDSIVGRENLFLGITGGKFTVNSPVLSLEQEILANFKAGAALSNPNELNLADGLRYLIQESAFRNVFFLLAYSRWNIGDRIVSLPDEAIGSLLNDKLLSQLFGDISGKLTADGTFMTMLQYVMSAVYYQYVSVPTASRIVQEGRPVVNSFILKPHTMMSVPPMCNVLYPDQYTKAEFNRNFLAEPTRLRMATDHLGFGEKVNWNSVSVGGAFLTDDEGVLRTELEEVYRFSKEGTYSPLVLLSKEEQAKGIVPAWTNMKSPAYSDVGKIVRDSVETGSSIENTDGSESVDANKPVGSRAVDKVFDINKFRQSDAPDQVDEYIKQVAFYEYKVERHRARVATVDAPFNPNIVPGFPCLVLDSVVPFIGEVQGITYEITSDGYNMMSLNLGFCREALAGEETMKFFPPWINHRYRPENCGSLGKAFVTRDSEGNQRSTIADGAYQTLFGMNSIISQVRKSGESTDDITTQEAVRRLIKEYATASVTNLPDVLNRTRRGNIVNRGQYYSILKAESAGSTYVNADGVVAIDSESDDGKSAYLDVQEGIWGVVRNVKSPAQTDAVQEEPDQVVKAFGGDVKVNIATKKAAEAKLEILQVLSDAIGPMVDANRAVVDDIAEELTSVAHADNPDNVGKALLSLIEGNDALPSVALRAPVTTDEINDGIKLSDLDIAKEKIKKILNELNKGPGDTIAAQANAVS
jgi:hypothetical protein